MSDVPHIPYDACPISPDLMDDAQRIEAALEVVRRNVYIDGEHHKMWLIDQMVRILTGSPLEKAEATGAYGRPFTHDRLAESDRYRAFVEEFTVIDEDDGSTVSTWDTGTHS